MYFIFLRSFNSGLNSLAKSRFLVVKNADLLSVFITPPPLYCFHVVCPSVSNISFPYYLEESLLEIKHIYIYKTNTFNKRVRARG